MFWIVQAAHHFCNYSSHFLRVSALAFALLNELAIWNVEPVNRSCLIGVWSRECDQATVVEVAIAKGNQPFVLTTEVALQHEAWKI